MASPGWRPAFPRSIGMICLCLFLVLFGVLHVTNITIQFADPALGFLALLAGILLLVGL